MFFSQIAKNAVSCWNSNTPYTPENHAIVDQNDTTMNYPVDLTVGQMDTLVNLDRKSELLFFYSDR